MRFEDVEPPLGDDPADPQLYRHERDWLDDRPSHAECDEDFQDWPRAAYSDGGL